jgi:hypothetical protein
MLEIVLWFAAITAVGELVILHTMNARLRAWILGSATIRSMFHVSFATLNLWIHWGTVTGSMTAVTAFVVSVVVLRVAQVVYLRKIA